jgi:hypothetical protein
MLGNFMVCMITAKRVMFIKILPYHMSNQQQQFKNYTRNKMPDDDDVFEINQPVLNSPDEHYLIPVLLLLLIIDHILNMLNISLRVFQYIAIGFSLCISS